MNRTGPLRKETLRHNYVEDKAVKKTLKPETTQQTSTQEYTTQTHQQQARNKCRTKTTHEEVHKTTKQLYPREENTQRHVTATATTELLDTTKPDHDSFQWQKSK